MKIRAFVLGTSLIIAVGSAGAFAQTAAPAVPAAPATMPAGGMDKAALSKACSVKADQQGLKGKARKKFRRGCKSGKA